MSLVQHIEKADTASIGACAAALRQAADTCDRAQMRIRSIADSGQLHAPSTTAMDTHSAELASRSVITLQNSAAALEELAEAVAAHQQALTALQSALPHQTGLSHTLDDQNDSALWAATGTADVITLHPEPAEALAHGDEELGSELRTAQHRLAAAIDHTQAALSTI